jgi:hypothetical protein
MKAIIKLCADVTLIERVVKLSLLKKIFIHITQISTAYASTQLERSLIFPRLIGACEQSISYVYF